MLQCRLQCVPCYKVYVQDVFNVFDPYKLTTQLWSIITSLEWTEQPCELKHTVPALTGFAANALQHTSSLGLLLLTVSGPGVKVRPRDFCRTVVYGDLYALKVEVVQACPKQTSLETVDCYCTHLART